ncbi:sensor domain-containing protein, partial [Actinoallomurus acaciae]
MRTGSPRTALEAVTWHRLPISGWPWRSAGYLLTTLLMTFPALAGPAVAWLVAARLTAGGHRVALVALLIPLGVALVGALGPLVAMPLANLERRRLRMVDTRPIGSGHRHPRSGGPVSWLRARYTDAATWREVGYACLLATAAPVL